ncbi:MAG TPA: hypothetical protein VHO23_02820 [Candidatus Paceibacterota bacterium]|nr:hypothetical protein [Candidatus Paceibacterota bacterium]
MTLRIASGLILALLVVYGFVKAFPLIAGPEIVLASPTPYGTVHGATVPLSGTAKRTETLTLNGATLLIDEQGHFETALTLPSGTGILSLLAEDRFGRTVSREIAVFIP